MADHIPTRAEIEQGELENLAANYPAVERLLNRAKRLERKVARMDEAERLLDRLLGAHENEQYPPSIHGEVRRFLDG